MTRAAVTMLALALALPAWADDAPSWRAQVAALPLPLTVVPATTAARALLVLFSGDGGWAEVDQTVSAALAERGVTTIGWSSLSYFLTAKTPERVADDLRQVVRALAPAHLPIVVGGYSFGAEVVPVAVAGHWSADERARLAGMLLLAPSESASFQIDPLDWVREPPPDPRYRVNDFVRRLGGARVVCVTGVDDATTSCGAFADVPGVTVVRVPGTHHFENGGIPRLVDAAMAQLFAKAGPAK